MSLTTSVEELEGNKVRLHVAIPAADFEQAIDAAFRKLAREVKMPGFRPGKAPRRLLEARMGTEIARDQALRDSLPEYYAEAVVAEDVDVIAPPEIDITAGEEDGDVEFDAVVEIRPVVTVEGHDALRIEIEKPEASEEVVDQQVDSLRDRFADLADSADPLTDGDYAEIDIKGSLDGESVEGLTATDYLYEVGSGIVVPLLDEQLHGKRPGDIVVFDDTLPERFGDRADEEVSFQVLVKDAKKKVLPELTDEWVGEVSEFDTVDALKDDIRTRLDIYARVQASMAVREKIFEAAAELVADDVPDTLVNSEMERRLHDLAHRLEEQGIGMTIPQYLAATGQDQQEFVDNVRVGAIEAVRADLALRAVIAQEEIEATDEELDAEIDQLAERMNEKPAKVRKDLERRGVVEAVRSDIARGKALAFLIEHAEVVDADGEIVDLSLPQPTTTDDDGRNRRGAESVIEPIQNAFYIPNVTEQTARGAETRSVFDRLLKDRIIFLGTPIDDVVSNIVIAQLLHLESEDPDKDISIYINSPGGEITGLFAMYDTMQFIKPDISTICLGQAASAAAVILASGTPGKRYILPHSRVLIHQPHGGASGQAVDIEIQAKEIVRMRDSLDEILAYHTGQEVAKVANDTDRDFIMGANEAKEYGIVDDVITNRDLAAVGVPAGVS
jgi:trigger factor/ATP-dependent Clp endopeptidase proteolytic subunit ClpP